MNVGQDAVMIPPSVADQWFFAPDGPKTVRVDLTGVKHKVRGLNWKDARLLITDCGIVVAWGFHNPRTANKDHSDCGQCF